MGYSITYSGIYKMLLYQAILFSMPSYIYFLLQKGHVLGVLFRCRHCSHQEVTWSSSRIFGGHYFANQK